ncbi:trypsin-like peptidase domain-containing protein [Streptomyces sp. NPDC048349]|uniref:trypsin-like peptidase domain-containing protein n=1 Tax=Streptomyces sp. NPDC048349 TaxID=3155486 RepID=UPI00342AA3DD
MRRLLTMAAAAAALLAAVGPPPAAEAWSAAPGAAGRWTARAAESFWTAERMAAATALPPDPVPGAAAGTGPAAAADPDPWPAPPPLPWARPLPPPEPEPAPTPGPAGSPSPAAPTPVPSGDPAAPAVTAPTPAPVPAPVPAPAVPSARPAPAAVRLPATSPGVGQDFDGVPVAGRLFLVKGGGSYFCTASVVASPGRNLVLSAAHCLTGSDTRQVAFVPRYTRARPQPYGMFPVVRDAAGRSRIWIDPRYRSQGPDRAATLDVAFAQVGPDSRGRPVQDVVGGNRLVTGAGYAHRQVTLIGHPASAARPRVCVNRTVKFTSRDARIPGSFLRIACTGYPGGTSGGPFLARYDARTGTGDVVGVIGGWKTGGDTADTSYSSYFGRQIRKLYEKAVAGAKAG